MRRDEAGEGRPPRELTEVACLNREVKALDRTHAVGRIVRRPCHWVAKSDASPFRALTMAGPIESQLIGPNAVGRLKSR